ncbi:DMT family transporter [Rhodococcus rhodnii]|uniref:Transport protein n=2 Tax=Rhodococcus rhodnii TaxID=38312 RepID=R7WTB4_9NOCA|nr:DMT family transporter [Rhodococcus rhodnii]EOM78526.1 transport protein [Rhodococcus rhodnii LMG 5362]TXG92746.1 DMT family transporter [Rhodococcus rhodnii]
MRVPLGVQYTATALAWGSSFLFVKVGLEGLSFTQVVVARLVLGSAALTAVLITRRRLPPWGIAWAHFTVLAFVQCIAPWLLFAWAGIHLDSGLASIYNATTPLMTTAVAALVLADERLTGPKATGLAIGFGGVLTVLAPWNLALSGPITAQLACLGATACYGVALVYLRRFVLPRGFDAPTVAFAQITIAAVLMAVAAPVVAATPVHLTPAVIGAMIGLGAVGTGLAFVWNINVVRAWGPTAASTVTYLTPVVGVVLGALLLGERVTWNQPVGALLVVAGILVTRRARPRSPGDAPLPLAVAVPPPQGDPGPVGVVAASDERDGLTEPPHRDSP